MTNSHTSTKMLFIITISTIASAKPMNTCNLQSQCLEVEFHYNNKDNIPDLMCLRFADGEHCQKTVDGQYLHSSIGNDESECLSWGCVDQLIDQETTSGFCTDTSLCVAVDCTLPFAQQFGTFFVEDSLNPDEPNMCGTFDDAELAIFGSFSDGVIAECTDSDSNLCESTNCGEESCLSSCVWNIDYTAQCPMELTKDTTPLSPKYWVIMIVMAFVLGLTVGIVGLTVFILYREQDTETESGIKEQDRPSMAAAKRLTSQSIPEGLESPKSMEPEFDSDCEIFRIKTSDSISSLSKSPPSISSLSQ